MLQQGNHNDAKQFAFGIKRQGNLYAIKLRFKEDIANRINAGLTAQHLMITNTSNKGTRTIYGHCTQYELDILDRVKNRSKGERLMEQALQLLYSA
jgi:hypothetical protein